MEICVIFFLVFANDFHIFAYQKRVIFHLFWALCFCVFPPFTPLLRDFPLQSGNHTNINNNVLQTLKKQSVHVKFQTISLDFSWKGISLSTFEGKISGNTWIFLPGCHFPECFWRTHWNDVLVKFRSNLDQQTIFGQNKANIG